MSFEKDFEAKTNYFDVHSSAKSIDSSADTLYTLFEEDAAFHPTRKLIIDAHGIGIFRFPVPSNELEIPIYSEEGKKLYTSKRAKRSSGSCVLSSFKEGDIVETEYFFGPGRDPILRVLDPAGKRATEAKVQGMWLSRAVEFEFPGRAKVEWGYEKEKKSNGGRVNLIVLREAGCGKGGAGKRGRTIARLVRSDETRTPGSSRCSAGNGGELLIDESGLEALALDEGLVVASCLVMLKKEVDRRRLHQAMAIGVMCSGGS